MKVFEEEIDRFRQPNEYIKILIAHTLLCFLTFSTIEIHRRIEIMLPYQH